MPNPDHWTLESNKLRITSRGVQSAKPGAKELIMEMMNVEKLTNLLKGNDD